MSQRHASALGIATLKITVVTFERRSMAFCRSVLETTVAARRAGDVIASIAGGDAIMAAAVHGGPTSLDADIMRETREAAFSSVEPHSWNGLTDDVRNGLRDVLSLADHVVYGEVSVEIR